MRYAQLVQVPYGASDLEHDLCCLAFGECVLCALLNARKELSTFHTAKESNYLRFIMVQ